MKDYIVAKSNSLITGGHFDLSVTEQKIILMLASMVQPGDEIFKIYNLNIKEFNKLLGIKGTSKNTELRKITKALKSKVFEIKEGKDILQLSWLGGVRYKTQEGYLEISLDMNLKPYLLNLGKLYTSYKLENILQMKSKYSIRFYELLRCRTFKDFRIKDFIIPIDELKTNMQITEKSYNLYTNFKLNIVDRAQKEIGKFTDLQFTYKEIKEGRKVIALKFFIEKNEKWQKSDADEIFKQYDLLGNPDDIYK